MSFLLLPVGFDLQLLVEHFNPVGDNTCVLKSDVLDDSTCLILLEDVRGSANLTFLTMCLGMIAAFFALSSSTCLGFQGARGVEVRLTVKIVDNVPIVLASGVDMVLEKDLAGFALQEMEIHPLMFLIRTLSMILQIFYPPSTTPYPIDQSPPQEMSIQDMEDLKQQYLDEIKSMINQIQNEDYHNERIDIHYKRECEIKIDELKVNFNGMSIEINKKKELRQLEQAANLSTYTT
nr:hypothetical protein [Tanacetum cinerariifolium]